MAKKHNTYPGVATKVGLVGAAALAAIAACSTERGGNNPLPGPPNGVIDVVTGSSWLGDKNLCGNLASNPAVTQYIGSILGRSPEAAMGICKNDDFNDGPMKGATFWENDHPLLFVTAGRDADIARQEFDSVTGLPTTAASAFPGQSGKTYCVDHGAAERIMIITPDNKVIDVETPPGSIDGCDPIGGHGKDMQAIAQEIVKHV